jgi:hypothetical protein
MKWKVDNDKESSLENNQICLREGCENMISLSQPSSMARMKIHGFIYEVVVDGCRTVCASKILDKNNELFGL